MSRDKHIEEMAKAFVNGIEEHFVYSTIRIAIYNALTVN